jgi:serine/threonine protein kinase
MEEEIGRYTLIHFYPATSVYLFLFLNLGLVIALLYYYRGKFGTVFKCREKKTGLRLAAKFVQAAKKADRINVEREVEIMKSLRNPRLIQLYDAFDDGKKEICLLLEL